MEPFVHSMNRHTCLPIVELTGQENPRGPRMASDFQAFPGILSGRAVGPLRDCPVKWSRSRSYYLSGGVKNRTIKSQFETVACGHCPSAPVFTWTKRASLSRAFGSLSSGRPSRDATCSWRSVKLGWRATLRGLMLSPARNCGENSATKTVFPASSEVTASSVPR